MFYSLPVKYHQVEVYQVGSSIKVLVDRLLIHAHQISQLLLSFQNNIVPLLSVIFQDFSRQTYSLRNNPFIFLLNTFILLLFHCSFTTQYLLQCIPHRLLGIWLNISPILYQFFWPQMRFDIAERTKQCPNYTFTYRWR